MPGPVVQREDLTLTLGKLEPWRVLSRGAGVSITGNRRPLAAT